MREITRDSVTTGILRTLLCIISSFRVFLDLTATDASCSGRPRGSVTRFQTGKSSFEVPTPPSPLLFLVYVFPPLVLWGDSPFLGGV